MANMSIFKNGENNLIGSRQTVSSLSKHPTVVHGRERLYTEIDSSGHTVSRCLTPYECQLEDDVEELQEALLKISSDYAKIQFGVRQVALASSSERDSLLKDLEHLTSQGLDDTKRSLDYIVSSPANIRVKQNNIFCQLRGRLKDLTMGACFQQECYGLKSRSMIACEGGTNNADLFNIEDQKGEESQEYIFNSVRNRNPVDGNKQLARDDMEYNKEDNHGVKSHTLLASTAK
ncbi:uncharacterized protein LOC108031528 [Drosophila biarmipes]|uniref:uncharacterized protein LOC108031528 n=1 Tax=Drosophila biarmipes TaxID=125945 RepID=UPI0007E73B32|nr:uncharacterized protein LOC108031528 [Drosophila biarmipes]